MVAAIKRRFVDLDEGQIHLREAGRDLSGVPLVMLHQASGASRAMAPLMQVIGETRPVIAPDLPGNGDSFAPAMAQPVMADYGDAVAQVLDAMGLERVALYGFHAGASVAIELALAHPERISAVILDSMGLYTTDEAANISEAYVPKIERHPHGLHMAQAWHYVRDTYLFWPWFETSAEHARGVGLPATDDIHDKVMEVLKSLDTFGDYYRAAFLHDKAALLPDLRCSVLVTAGTGNSQLRHMQAIAALVEGADTLETPGVYDHASMAETARMLNLWLDTHKG